MSFVELIFSPLWGMFYWLPLWRIYNHEWLKVFLSTTHDRKSEPT